MTFLDRAEQFLRVVGPLVAGDQPVKPVNGFQLEPGEEEDTRPALPGASVLLDGVPPELLLRALPDAARSAATVLWRTSQWTIGTTLKAGNIVLQGTITGQSVDAIGVALLGEMRQSLLGAVGIGAWTGDSFTAPEGTSLADQMNALLDASADVGYHESAHPAYNRLLAELTPDEARILRLFAQRGPQPAVDVRTRKLLGGGSRLVEPGLTMIARYAGLTNTVRVPSYLDNMSRLGLIRFDDDALPDQRLYDVLEAQQEVKEALSKAGRGMTIRRHIELTVFGENLCSMTGLMPAPVPTITALPPAETAPDGIRIAGTPLDGTSRANGSGSGSERNRSRRRH
jgi:hypothetical protein